jgi:hypothetical protein
MQIGSRSTDSIWASNHDRLHQRAGLKAAPDQMPDHRTALETLEVVQTVQRKFSWRACETLSQPPVPFYAIACDRPKALRNRQRTPSAGTDDLGSLHDGDDPRRVAALSTSRKAVRNDVPCALLSIGISAAVHRRAVTGRGRDTFPKID